MYHQILICQFKKAIPPNNIMNITISCDTVIYNLTGSHVILCVTFAIVHICSIDIHREGAKYHQNTENLKVLKDFWESVEDFIRSTYSIQKGHASQNVIHT